MFPRLLELPARRSTLLSGPRGTGKSTLLRARLPSASTYFVNLLESDTEARLSRDSRRFERDVLALPWTISTVVVDEVQKLPRLLDARRR